MTAMTTIETQEDDLLIDGRKILQPKNGYHFSSDSVRLANFVRFRSKDKIVELCAGSGIIGILLALRGASHVQMVELQKELALLAQQNVALNNLSESINVQNMPLQGCHKTLGSDFFDIIVCNPPFEKAKSGLEKNQITIAKFELEVSFEEICREAERLLKTGGKFFFVLPARRVFEAAITLSKFNFKIKQCAFFSLKKEADTAYIMAAKGGKDGAKIEQLENSAN